MAAVNHSMKNDLFDMESIINEVLCLNVELFIFILFMSLVKKVFKLPCVGVIDINPTLSFLRHFS